MNKKRATIIFDEDSFDETDLNKFDRKNIKLKIEKPSK